MHDLMPLRAFEVSTKHFAQVVGLSYMCLDTCLSRVLILFSSPIVLTI